MQPGVAGPAQRGRGRERDSGGIDADADLRRRRIANAARGEHARIAAGVETGWKQQHGDARGGWPAYEFSDGIRATFSGLVRKGNGDPAIRLWSQSSAATANRLTVEFQDEFNEYQQDSLALVDVDDALLTDRQVTAAYRGAGIAEFRSSDSRAAVAIEQEYRRVHADRFRDDG